MPADARSSPGHPTSSQLQWALQRAAGSPVSAGPITIARPLIGARTRSATLSPAARPRLRPPRPPARSAAPGGGNDAAGVCIRRTEKPLRRAMGRARIGDATSLLATSWGRWRTGPRPSCRCGLSAFAKAHEWAQPEFIDVAAMRLDVIADRPWLDDAALKAPLSPNVDRYLGGCSPARHMAQVWARVAE